MSSSTTNASLQKLMQNVPEHCNLTLQYLLHIYIQMSIKDLDQACFTKTKMLRNAECQTSNMMVKILEIKRELLELEHKTLLVTIFILLTD